jgi:predicted dehydrogenase
LASHQIDIADWMFGMTPESVVGVGGNDYWKDGRDIYDNIQLIFTYPKGQKLIYHAISNNAHMPYKGIANVREVGEIIMGDAGTLHTSLDRGTGHGMWFIEPNPPQQAAKTGQAKENWTAGATVVEGAVSKGFPILPMNEFELKDTDSFLSKELKFAKRWLYGKGILVPEELRDPVGVALEDFLLCIRDSKKPKADLEVGLADSIAVILANLAMDEERKVKFSEFETMGKGKPAAPPKRGTGARTSG